MNIYVDKGNAVECLQKLVDNYAPGNKVLLKANHIAYTENPLVLIGAMQQIYSLSGVKEDPVREISKIKRGLADFTSYEFCVFKNSDELVFYVDSDGNEFVYLDEEIKWLRGDIANVPSPTYEDIIIRLQQLPSDSAIVINDFV